MAKTKYKQQAWQLDDLFPAFGAPEMEESLSTLEEQVKAFEDYRPQLTETADSELLLTILNAYESLYRNLSRLMAYAGLSFAADTQDQQAQTYLARFRQLAADADNRTLFFKLWWKALDDETADRLTTASGDYHYWLEALRLQRPYTLSEPEERVINLKDVNGPNALLTIFSTITDRYMYKLTVDGEEQELTRDELQVYYRHHDPKMRAAAYQELYRVFEEDLPVLGQIYQYVVRDWYSEGVELRGFASPVRLREIAAFLRTESESCSRQSMNAETASSRSDNSSMSVPNL